MRTIGGLPFLLVCVFDSYLVSGGSAARLVEALPFEPWTIGGAAIGSFVMANSIHDAKHTLGGFSRIVKGATFKKPDYVDLLSLLYYLMRLANTKGNMALASHIERRRKAQPSRNSPRSWPTITPVPSSAITGAW
jgi:chemotaxis protein MotA